MAKFSKEFSGVPDGEIYPVDYQPGDECPAELEAAARSVGAVGKGKGAKPDEPAAGEAGEPVEE